MASKADRYGCYHLSHFTQSMNKFTKHTSWKVCTVLAVAVFIVLLVKVMAFGSLFTRLVSYLRCCCCCCSVSSIEVFAELLPNGVVSVVWFLLVWLFLLYR